MATFVPLTNIQPVLNYHNLTELYVKVLERFQSLTVLKQKMVSHFKTCHRLPWNYVDLVW